MLANGCVSWYYDVGTKAAAPPSANRRVTDGFPSHSIDEMPGVQAVWQQPMHSHKVIWTITAAIVVAAIVVVATRKPAAPQGSPHVVDLSPAQVNLLVESMLACLEEDPQARRIRTRYLVEAVAALAEEGGMETAETSFALGVLRYGQRWKNAPLAKSEAAFRRAIELRPDWPLPYNGLGLTLMYLERYEEAETAYRHAIQLAPNWSRPHNDLAVLLRHTNRLDEAEAEALIALSLRHSVANNNNYGNVLLKRGVWRAEAQYRKAIELTRRSRAVLQSGLHRRAPGDRDAMLAHLNVAIVLGDVSARKPRR